MPQMNPMNWLLLFTFFCSIFLGVAVKTHYMCLSQKESSLSMKKNSANMPFVFKF